MKPGSIVPDRQPVYGTTVARSFNGLLDEKLATRRAMKEAVKQLHKIAFAEPNMAGRLQGVIDILEGK